MKDAELLPTYSIYSSASLYKSKVIKLPKFDRYFQLIAESDNFDDEYVSCVGVLVLRVQF